MHICLLYGYYVHSQHICRYSIQVGGIYADVRWTEGHRIFSAPENSKSIWQREGIYAHDEYYDPGVAYMLCIEVGLVFMSIQCKCCKTYMQDIPAYMQHTVRPNLGLSKPWLGQLWSSPNHNNVSQKYSGRLCWHQTYNAHSKLYVVWRSDASNAYNAPSCLSKWHQWCWSRHNAGQQVTSASNEAGQIDAKDASGIILPCPALWRAHMSDIMILG